MRERDPPISAAWKAGPMREGRAAAWPPAREVPVGKRGLYFLGLDLLEDVALEVARTAEEAHLGMGHRQPVRKALLDQARRTNQICNLKQLVVYLPRPFHECNGN